MRRALDAVLLVGVVSACDSGSLGSHSDRGPVKLAFTAQPKAAVADAAIGPVAVAVQDAYGNTVLGARVSITIAIGTNAGGATLTGTTTLVSAEGVAVFSDLIIDRGGSGYTLTAEATGLTSAASGPIDVTGPVKLAFIAQPTAALAGAVMRPVVVAVQDAAGNNLPNAHATITVAIGTNPAAGALSGTTTLPALGGVAVFSDLVIDNPGFGYALIAEASALLKTTSRPIEVTVTPLATQLAFAVQPGASASVLTRQAMRPAVQVSILDDLGNVVTSSTMDVTVAIAAGPAGATLSGTSTVAAVNGVATFRDLSVDVQGVYILAASACSLTEATSTPFNVTSLLYVGNWSGDTAVYTAGATGNATPTATMAANGWGLAFDAAGRLYDIDNAGSRILIYAAGSTFPPIATIEGTNTGLAEAYALAFDGAGLLYVGNWNATITVYAAGATANTTPTATIGGANTGLSRTTGLAFDGAGRLYVTSGYDANSITVYAAGATGTPRPSPPSQAPTLG